jgi:hypothetical protein
MTSQPASMSRPLSQTRDRSISQFKIVQIQAGTLPRVRHRVPDFASGLTAARSSGAAGTRCCYPAASSAGVVD